MSVDLLEKIQRLKEQRNAIILAHNYQPGEIQDLADYAGDSLGLSVEAARTNAETIVFCGVRFMAETAAILSPKKTVLLPEKHAGCPMADMINAAQLQEMKDKYPDALVVCYVNSTAEVKALSDYCCTSGNALELVESLPKDRLILFVPDKNLGGFINERIDREMILWPGYCSTHVRILVEDVQKARQEHPDALLLAHPECNPDVRLLADELLSTGQMLKFARTSNVREFIIATENGILHTLRKQNPDKLFYPVTEKAICPNMKKISVEKVLWALQDMQYHITVPEPIAANAKRSLDRMIDVLPK
ncbi:MAG: quinolinate synthase NadA [Planctomycetes bacterium]|nr:quinolinate synthase NadA [Planctomycetota bacterium]